MLIIMLLFVQNPKHVFLRFLFYFHMFSQTIIVSNFRVDKPVIYCK